MRNILEKKKKEKDNFTLLCLLEYWLPIRAKWSIRMMHKPVMKVIPWQADTSQMFVGSNLSVGKIFLLVKSPLKCTRMIILQLTLYIKHVIALLSIILLICVSRRCTSNSNEAFFKGKKEGKHFVWIEMEAVKVGCDADPSHLLQTWNSSKSDCLNNAAYFERI